MNLDIIRLIRQACNTVDRYTDELTAITQKLIAIPSVNPPGSYEQIAQTLFDLYSHEGLNPLFLSADASEIKHLGLSYPRPNVVAYQKGTGKRNTPVFCLDAHMDVVGVGDESAWTFAPFGATVHDSKIYGRGAADTKCHLAAQIIIIKIIRELGIELAGDLLFTATVDDEIGAWPGMGFLLEKGLSQARLPLPQYHIASEPTGIEHIGCLARGRLWYEFILKGKSCHGGNPQQGINAIEKAMLLAHAVKSYTLQTHPLMGMDTISIGMIHGGEAINVVPATCRITFDVRPTTPKEVFQQFMDSTIERLSKEDHDFVIESMKLHNDRQTGGIGPDHEFIKRVQTTVKDLTGKNSLPTGNMNGYSSLGNAYWSSMHGIAGIMYGAGNFNQTHTIDEYIEIPKLVEMTKIFLSLIIQLCY